MMIEIILFDRYTKCMNDLEEPLIPEMISVKEAASVLEYHRAASLCL